MPATVYLPPAVSYPFSRPRVLAWAALGASLLGLAVVVLWLAGQQVRPGPYVLGLGGWLVCVLLAVAWWRGTAGGELAWGGGEGWSITMGGWAQAHCLSPRVCLDLQSSLLLLVKRQGGASEWLWLDRRRLPRRWPSLRRALAADMAAGGGGV